MAKKKRKKKFRLIHMTICFLLIYITLIFWNQRKLMQELQVKMRSNMLEVQNLEKEIESLNKEIESSDTLQFIEKVARDDLGMVKPREIIYIDTNKNRNPFLNIRKRQN